VIGTDSYTFDVLTGWVANEMTSIIAGEHRAMTLCLDFPSTGASAITIAAGLLGSAGESGGTGDRHDHHRLIAGRGVADREGPLVARRRRPGDDA
jgi:hypothetical protein